MTTPQGQAPTDTNTASGAAARFTKKPVTITASQWFKPGDHPMVEQYDPEKAGSYIKGPGPYGWIKTLEGGHIVSPGDWIITGVAGEHYPCKPDIFAATYSRAALASAPAQPVVPHMSASEVNALPTAAREYIHQLATNADPAGMVRENMQLHDTNAGLQAMYRKAADALETVTGCFRAAECEGLQDALADTADERLKDLVERRLMYALYAAQDAAAPAQPVAEPGTAYAARPLVITSAPERIWLDLGFDPREEDAHFSNLHDLTWSADNATGDGIEYVRADIRGQAMNRDEIIAMAREAGFTANCGHTDRGGTHHPAINALNSSVPVEWLERFAALVATR